MTRRVVIDGHEVIDPRSTRAWRTLVARVIRDEPECWLKFPDVCTGASTTGDHVLTVTARPDLALVRANVRGACAPCNELRKAMPVELIRVDNDEPAPPALGLFD